MENNAQGIFYNPQKGTCLEDCVDNVIIILRGIHTSTQLYPYMYLHYNGMFFVINDLMTKEGIIEDIKRRVKEKFLMKHQT